MKLHLLQHEDFGFIVKILLFRGLKPSSGKNFVSFGGFRVAGAYYHNKK
jgi:hypothetical protein